MVNCDNTNLVHALDIKYAYLGSTLFATQLIIHIIQLWISCSLLTGIGDNENDGSVRRNRFLLLLTCWRSPTEQVYFLMKESNDICLMKISIHYVLKELRYKNICLITAVTLFMKILCVVSDVKKETWIFFRERIMNTF